jgi:hypothetical protein
VIVSTIPDDLLPLDGSPSEALQSFFTHLWSPIDARLLSTHSMPSQQSAFQVFFKDAVDCTVYMIGKATRKDATPTVEWLIEEQLVGRAWSEGVLDMGARAGKRGQVATEHEAMVFGKALGRVGTQAGVIPLLQDSLMGRAFQTDNGELTKPASALLSRSLNIIASMPEIETGRMVGEISREASGKLGKGPIFADVLLAALASRPEDVTSDTKGVSILSGKANIRP